MFRIIRIAYKVVGTLFFSGLSLALVVCSRVLGPLNKPFSLNLRRSIYRFWARSVLRVLGVKVKVIGLVPPLPYLLISNHVSYIDILVLASQQPGRFVAKIEIRSWPLIGWMCRCVDTVFVNRSSRRDVVRVAELMSDAMDDGDGVILFPEGTSTNGSLVADFKGALLAPAAKGNIPVRAAAIRYETPEDQIPAYLSVAWWGGMEFAPHFLTMASVNKISAQVTFIQEEFRDEDRKRLTERLHQAITENFEPMTDVVWDPKTFETSS